MQDSYSLRLSSPDRHLEKIPVYLYDRSGNSEYYFRLSDIPTELCSGRNIIKIAGNNSTLEPNSTVLIEVKDAKGMVLYTDVQDIIDRLGNRYISVHVHPETAAGAGTITIVGVAVVDFITNPYNPTGIPPEWVGKHNIKWQRNVVIEPLKRNPEKIIFAYDTTPTVILQEIYRKFNILHYTTGSTYSQSISGDFLYSFSPTDLDIAINSSEYNLLYRPASYDREDYTSNNNVQIRKQSAEVFTGELFNSMYSSEWVSKGITAPQGFTVNYHNSPIITSATDVFEEKFIGAKIAIPDMEQPVVFGYSYKSSEDLVYQTRIGTVQDSKTISLSSPYSRVLKNASNFEQTYYPNRLNFNTMIITGSETPNNTESYAYKNIIRAQFSGLKPLIGNIQKIKTYVKSKSGISDYKLIGENTVLPESLLIDINTIDYKRDIGNITSQDIIDTYWTHSLIDTSDTLSLEYNKTVVLNSIYTNGTLNSGKWKINNLVEPQTYYNPDKYQLSFDIYGTKSNSVTPSINFYMSGSSFDSKLEEDVYGKYIGGIHLQQESLKINGLNINFTPDNTGTGALNIIVNGGNWYIGNIQIKSSSEPGYSPSFFVLDIEVPTTWDNESFDFKFEFCNSKDEPADDIIYVKDVIFNKGNSTYIQGTDNYMTGSMIITGSINMSGSFLINGLDIANIVISGSCISSSYAISSSYSPPQILINSQVAFGNSNNHITSSIFFTVDENTPAVKTVNITGSLNVFGSTKTGGDASAIGIYSHAEGSNTVSFGIASHAEGSSAISSGSYSHAEGLQTISIADYSHTEGDKTQASGNYSHAEGQQTIASGNWSHAEGSITTAVGIASHAEGDRTIAIGGNSHAEGYYTISSGTYSHAEGYHSIATGFASHADGYYTNATGLYSRASGDRNISVGDYSNSCGSENETRAIYSSVSGKKNLLLETATGSAIIAAIEITGSQPYTLYTNNINVTGNLTINNTDIRYTRTEVPGAQITGITGPALWPTILPAQGVNTVVLIEQVMMQYDYTAAPYTGSAGTSYYVWHSASFAQGQSEGVTAPPVMDLTNGSTDLTAVSRSFMTRAIKISTPSIWFDNYTNSPFLISLGNYTHPSTGGSLIFHCFYRVFTIN